jgi:hypothetical protein
MNKILPLMVCFLLLFGCKKNDVSQTSVELTSLTYSGGNVHVSWSATNASAIESYSIEQSTNNFNFLTIQVIASGMGNTYSHPVTVGGTYYYRIMASTADTAYYSNVRRIVI